MGKEWRRVEEKRFYNSRPATPLPYTDFISVSYPPNGRRRMPVVALVLGCLKKSLLYSTMAILIILLLKY